MYHTSSGSSGNHSSPGSPESAVRSGPLPLSKALVGFTNAKLAEGLSPRTVDSYLDDLQKWVERTGDREIAKVTGAEISAYLAWLRTDYTPHRFSGKTHPLWTDHAREVAAVHSFADLHLFLDYKRLAWVMVDENVAGSRPWMAYQVHGQFGHACGQSSLSVFEMAFPNVQRRGAWGHH